MSGSDFRPIEWVGDVRSGTLRLLDQRLLPQSETWLSCSSVEEVADAIRWMVVRGAPAIGITAAFGMVLAAMEGEKRGLHPPLFRAHLAGARAILAATRPTAANLFWALERCWRCIDQTPSAEMLLRLALSIHEEEVEANRRIGQVGASRVEPGAGVLTHCNAGALATGGVGTAFAVLSEAHAQGKKIHVYVDETRPRLQGARLTAWELSRLRIPYTIICDGAAASLMAKRRVQLCVTGADRIARNGDTANKIGTYSVAVNAQHHDIPFYVAAPRSTFDVSIRQGSEIPIEERADTELTTWGNERVCPQSAAVYNPAFDVTPGSLIRGIFTEMGEISPVNEERICATLGG
jgi:methylthioribose-1-phosphate isomerase